MGFIDKIIDGASDVVSDIAQNIANGDIGGAAVEIATAGTFGMWETGDVLQEQIEIGLETGVDFIRGEEVALEYDPEVVPELVDASMQDAGDAVEIISTYGI